MRKGRREGEMGGGERQTDRQTDRQRLRRTARQKHTETQGKTLRLADDRDSGIDTRDRLRKKH